MDSEGESRRVQMCLQLTASQQATKSSMHATLVKSDKVRCCFPIEGSAGSRPSTRAKRAGRTALNDGEGFRKGGRGTCVRYERHALRRVLSTQPNSGQDSTGGLAVGRSCLLRVRETTKWAAARNDSSYPDETQWQERLRKEKSEAWKTRGLGNKTRARRIKDRRSILRPPALCPARPLRMSPSEWHDRF